MDSMCVVKTIYALFINTGTVQFISWSDLRETGTIIKALTGGDINQTINMLKKLFVSLMWLKTKYLMEKQKLFGASILIWLEYYSIVFTLPEVRILRDFVRQYFISFRIVFAEAGLNYAQDLFYCYGLWKKFTKKLTSCGFSVSLTSRAHSSVPFDQVIEMFINRACKVIDEFSQITQNEVAIERWQSTHHLLPALREHMNKNIRKNTYSSSKYLQNINIPKNDNDAATSAVVS